MGFETPKKVSYQPYIYYNTLYLPTTKEIRENLEWPNNQKWTEEGKGGTPFYGVLVCPFHIASHCFLLVLNRLMAKGGRTEPF